MMKSRLLITSLLEIVPLNATKTLASQSTNSADRIFRRPLTTRTSQNPAEILHKTPACLMSLKMEV